MSWDWPSFDSTKDIRYHPYLRGAISRWLWRFYTYRLTRAGRWFLWLTAACAIYGSSTLDLQVYVPFTYAFGLWVVAIGAALLGAPRVSLRTHSAVRICAGDTLAVDVEIEGDGRLPVVDLFVLPNRLPPAIDSVEPNGVGVGQLAAGECARVRLALLCRRRGAYTLRGYRVQTDFPYGILRAYRVFSQDQALLVYPFFKRLSRLVVPTGRRYQPGGVALASRLGDSFEFIGSRGFREGDTLRNIDWRATARTQKLTMREYREEYFHRVAVILDTHVPARDGGSQREALERAISICASVSDYMAREEYILDLFAAGPNLYHLTAGRSLAYLDQVLDILACIEENPEEPFQVIEPELMEDLAQITTAICVLLDWNEARRAFVHRLRGEGLGIKVIVVRDSPCTIDPIADADLLGPIPVITKDDFARGVEDL